MPGSLKVTQTKSTISHIHRNRATIRALGLHGIGSSSILPDNPAVRGMPLGLPSLSPEDLQLVESWIAQGHLPD